jgi:superfamily II DNA or RNA helicase
MEIIVDDISSYVVDCMKVPKALAAIRDVCKARPEGYRFMKRYKSGVWDGYISLMHTTTKFPTGLLPFVAIRLKELGYHLQYKIMSQYKEPLEVKSDDLKGIVLRDYQIDAINTLLQRKRGVAKMATNSGKTEVMAGIIKALDIPHTIVIVPRKELLHQTAERFQYRLGIQVGKIGDGIWDRQQVTVAMLQTLHSRLDGTLDNYLLMVDECHHGSSDSVMDIMKQIRGGYRFGFSGTPLKNDVLSDMKLMAVTGRIVVDISNKFLITEGYSAVPKVYLHTIENFEDSVWEDKYPTAYEEMIVKNDKRNKIIASVAKEADGVVLILVNTLEHGRILQNMIKGSTFVHGSNSSDMRLGILTTMREKASGVFIASPIFDEGVDVSSIDTVILAGGGKSYVKLLQRIGRGLRKKEGNGNVLQVHDFIDDTNKYLLNHSDLRAMTYAKEGFETIIA